MAISDPVQDILASFDRLSPSERAHVLREIAKRLNTGRNAEELTGDELTFLTDQTFQMYDREEECNA
jgi:hypothetical protein